MLDISLIVLSAGGSSRFMTKAKKQWLRSGDLPLWLGTANMLASNYAFKDVIITGNSDDLRYMYKFCDFKIVKGGTTRQNSLMNALQYVNSEYVLVSDAARCAVPNSLTQKILEEAANADIIVPYLPVTDTVVYESETINRDKVKLIQTPQLSKTKILKAALAGSGEFTDESSAISAYGGSVKYILGDIKAEKLTFKNAKNSPLLLVAPPSKEIFTGTGFDAHAYEEGRQMYLGGVKIEENYGLKAHSDGDALIHALIDALLGAAGAGDIGEWFPDTNMKYKDISSVKLLENIVQFLTSVGFEIVHCDITLIAQKPKISPFKDAMSKKLASILNISPLHVNIKATTTENMGFTGREEGIAVQAAATLKYYDWTADENINC
ncbi:MAG: bifunctional 2-C-methyl-D-erythritol 4-phosphate cytidylyltransferase/2-C-methyl-D-erythritol 2,4-cyclodiphosphate synthase [Campylobacteraceae bacterium]|nr:bifunctional 2-C-methyl-D-erythritol 4-phosphate cytidylyltransferase/2-C-methyl-D-erythritol 2,4-cyclodiphosphate synthase [Campylobacteraceae bacterium]